ncbi:ATP-binding response regulator [Anaerovibrio sp.]|uniref:ATP-binding response regulator n=1 Tax=Anaerovibrio sp. TaxID=1872532 RepID=UPI003F1766EE
MQTTERNVLDQLMDWVKIIQSLSKVYTTVYYIDILNDSFIELAAIPEVRAYIGTAGRAQEKLNILPEKLALPEFSEDLHSFVELGTLDRRMNKARVVSYQYISPVYWPELSPGLTEEWVQCNFIECDRDSDGRLWHVIFATESVNAAKKQELEAQRRIREANDELTRILEYQKVQQEKLAAALSDVENVNARLQQEMQQKNDLIQEMEIQRDIIDGLSSEYYSVLLVDVETDVATIYRDGSRHGEQLGSSFAGYQGRRGGWTEGMTKYAEELVSEKCRKEFVRKLSIDRLRRGKRNYSFTYERVSGGNVSYLQAAVSFVQEKCGRKVAVIGARNVDSLIKSEKEQEMALQVAYSAAETANKAKTMFLSNMSHDMRTPMNGIIGMTAIAMRYADDREKVMDSLQKIDKASKHLLELINEVLDMSKIESGRVDLVEEEFNLADLIENMVNIMKPNIDEHHHKLTVNMSKLKHTAVIGDSLHLQKVFTNLLGNAIKYTPDCGKLKLKASEKPCAKEKTGCYEFVFEDNGIGMSEDYIKQVFEPFVRASDERLKNIQGTGLGMAITRNIVRMMGGDIEVRSKLGVGSQFVVTVYLKHQDAQEKEQGDEGQENQERPLEGIEELKLGGRRVLLAEDNDLNAEIAVEILELTGLVAERAADGLEAVSMLEEHPDGYYDLIFMDVQMPGMNGYEAARKIRGKRSEYCRQVPIIAMTANAFADDVKAAIKSGMNEHVAKPLNWQALAKVLQRWLK